VPFYQIVRPCAYVADGKPVWHRKAGAVVELTEVAALRLGTRVRLTRAPRPTHQPPAPEPEPAAETAPIAETAPPTADPEKGSTNV
jgi:hypothetical protein